METINLYDFMLDFVKELLEDYADGKRIVPDRDTRLLARDTLECIKEQHPDVFYTTSLRTGELIAIPIEY